MGSEVRKLGIDVLGAVSWGTHICYFYHTRQDLIDILVPYFQAGLENNESCIWITSKPLSVKEAEEAMREAVPNFSHYLASKQMKIIPHTEWFLKGGTFDLKGVLNAWIDKIQQTLDSGYDGLRVTGDMAWLKKGDWSEFIDYEGVVHSAIGKYRILAICTYPLSKINTGEIIDVERNHQYNLIKHKGELVLVGSPEHKKAEEALQESEELSSNLLTYSPHPILIINPDTSLRYVNPALEKLTGFSAEELIGRKVPYPWWTPETLQSTRRDFARAIHQGAVGLEELFQKKNGERFWVEITSTPVKHEGRLKYYRASWIDITERKRAEEKEQAIVKTALDGFWVNDLEGRFLEVNDAYCKMTGYTREELLKMSIQDIEAVESPEDVIQHINKGVEQGYIHFESRHRCKDGSIIDVEVNTNYLDVGGVKAFSFCRDITEHKQAEEKLQEQAQILERTNEIVICTDMNGYILSWNKGTERLYGYSAEEALGKHISFMCKDKQFGSLFYQQVIEPLLQKGSYEGEVEVLTKTGENKSIYLSLSPIRDSNGNMVMMCGYGTDVTERRQAEEAHGMLSRAASGRPLTELQKRFTRDGFKGLEDREIIELLLSLVLPVRKSRHLAEACIKRFQNLRDFLAAPSKELQEIGITPASMFCIKLLHELPTEVLRHNILERSVYKSSREIFDYLYYSMRDLKIEVFKIIYLNSRSQIIDTTDLFEGTADYIHIRPREIVESAITHGAAGLIFVHNHPSGDPSPSKTDKQLTRDLVFVGEILQIKVLDHIIIGENCYFSFADDGLIKKYENDFLDLKMKGVLASGALYRNYRHSNGGFHHHNEANALSRIGGHLVRK